MSYNFSVFKYADFSCSSWLNAHKKIQGLRDVDVSISAQHSATLITVVRSCIFNWLKKAVSITS